MSNQFIKKIKRRLKEDDIFTFFYRILFFFLQHTIRLLDLIKLKLFFLFKRDKKIVKSVNGSKMLLDLTDPGISRDLYFAGIREPKHTELIQKELNDSDVVIDIGANVGYYALLESRLVGKKGHVYAIEPIPENVKNLKENIELNNCENISVYQMGIGDSNRRDFIYLTAKSNWCSMKINKNSKNNKAIGKIDVKLSTLDDFVKDNKFPDLIRMDVEGYEIEIAKGMRNILDSAKPLKVFIELHCSMLDDLGFGLLETFVEKGFRIKYFFRDRSTLMLDKSKFIRRIYSMIGGKINGISEFLYEDVSLDFLKIKKSILKEEVFHVLLIRR